MAGADAAAAAPFDVRGAIETVMTASGRTRYFDRMRAFTVSIPGPWIFQVTFSIETGHPAGTCRHMSMSIDRAGRVPHPEAVWMVAQTLGFAGGLNACASWPEATEDGYQAINLAQPLALGAQGTA